jgi:hypothetical protein
MKTFKSFYIEQELQQQTGIAKQEIESYMKKMTNPVTVKNLLRNNIKKYGLEHLSGEKLLDALIANLSKEKKVVDTMQLVKKVQGVNESWMGDIFHWAVNVLGKTLGWFKDRLLDLGKELLSPFFGPNSQDANLRIKVSWLMVLMFTVGLPFTVGGLAAASGATVAMPELIPALGVASLILFWFKSLVNRFVLSET